MKSLMSLGCSFLNSKMRILDYKGTFSVRFWFMNYSSIFVNMFKWAVYRNISERFLNLSQPIRGRKHSSFPLTRPALPKRENVFRVLGTLWPCCLLSLLEEENKTGGPSYVLYKQEQNFWALGLQCFYFTGPLGYLESSQLVSKF